MAATFDTLWPPSVSCTGSLFAGSTMSLATKAVTADFTAKCPIEPPAESSPSFRPLAAASAADDLPEMVVPVPCRPDDLDADRARSRTHGRLPQPIGRMFFDAALRTLLMNSSAVSEVRSTSFVALVLISSVA